MTESDKWRIGVTAVRREFDLLSPERRSAATDIILRIMAVKKELAACFDGMNGGMICALCQGECCRAGRYHFTVVDLLAYLITGRPLFTPSFENGACPYLGEKGCFMEPEFRPYNCVSFLCERVETGADPARLQTFSALSDGLVSFYRELEQLFANRFQPGLLNNCERFLEGRAGGVLAGP